MGSAAQEFAEFGDYYIDKAIRAGKFPPSRREHYRRAWDHNVKGTKTLIDRLAPGVVASEPGGPAAPSLDEPAYPPEWIGPLPEPGSVTFEDAATASGAAGAGGLPPVQSDG